MWTGHAVGLGLVAVVSMIIGLVIGQVRIANLSMLYLVAVLATAAAFGRGPATLASVAAFLVFDWFYIEPLHTFTIADPAEWLQLLLFLATSLITGSLAAQLRQRAQLAKQREREASVLYDVVRLMAELEIDQALQAVAERIRQELQIVAVGIELAESGKPPMRAAAGLTAALPPADTSPRSATEVLMRSATPTGHGPAAPGRWIRVIPPRTAGPRENDRRHLHRVPVEHRDQYIGMITLVHTADSAAFSPADDRLLSAAAAQIALAVERRRLRQQATETEILRRTDELKTVLLNAVSHDLRTPLASIMASAGALLQRSVKWSEDERWEFAEAIESETRRLNQLVGNLLDLSRIEAGSLLIDKGWYDLSVLVDEVLGRLRPLTRQHRIDVSIPGDLPPMHLGYVEIDQVLSNLIENATKYTPPGTTIRVSARREGTKLRVEVADQGPGIPVGELSRLFEPFYRVKREGAQAKGTGLGLAVARGLVEAHGGQIWAEKREGGGAGFVFTLPIEEAVEARSESGEVDQ